MKGNPLMDIARHIIFPYYGKEFMISRPVSKGGDTVYADYDEMEAYIERLDEIIDLFLNPPSIEKPEIRFEKPDQVLY